MRWIGLLGASLALSAAPGPTLVEATEKLYSDLNDSWAAIQTIDSGYATSYRGLKRAEWQRRYRRDRTEIAVELSAISSTGLTAIDTRAVALMRAKVAAMSAESRASSKAQCSQAGDPLRKKGLSAALYACFDEIGGNLEFEGAKLNRLAVLDLLRSTEEPERRKALFLALMPLWQAINRQNEPNSPYRRLIRQAARSPKPNESLALAARTLGIDPSSAESWMVEALETWERVSGGQAMEPWDFEYQAGMADRALSASVPRESLLAITERYYSDLGAGLQRMGTLYDLDPRPGKSPVAYTDFATYGSMAGGVWQPSIPRISATYTHGGLALLNELVHEAGHAIHVAAVRTRPAFMDLGDALFVEAFADVVSWNTYQPAWQQKYIGRSAPESESLRSLYSSVMMDIAWSLFEIRMLRDPSSDPNLVWTEITRRYLHIVPHPEWSWWAVRGQLVDSPGYMINYGLGAVLTADLRRHIRDSLGPFETGDSRWYPWVSGRLLRYGLERDTPRLLREFLGRPVSPRALLDDLHRLASQ